jgi:hypothetical protein
VSGGEEMAISIGVLRGANKNSFGEDPGLAKMIASGKMRLELDSAMYECL